MHLRPYLVFDGRAREAMQFYQSVLGGKLDVMRYGDNPEMPSTPEMADRVMHAHLDSNGHSLMASDSMPGETTTPSSFGVALAYDTAAEAKRVFDGLAEGGKVNMPLSPTFWAESFGMVTDRFGTNWLVNGNMKQM